MISNGFKDFRITKEIKEPTLPEQRDLLGIVVYESETVAHEE